MLVAREFEALDGPDRNRGVPFENTGCSAAWKRVSFGARKSLVQIQPPRHTGCSAEEARLAWDEKVVGSIPITLIIKFRFFEK